MPRLMRMKTIGIIAVMIAACLFPAAVVSQTLVWEGAWSSSTPYTAGQVVSYLGGTYICITGNTNVPPPTSTVDWTALAQSGATVSVGTTVTGAPLTNAAVANVGTSKNAVLNFTIPQGYVSGGGGGIPWPSNAGLAAYSGSSSWRAPTYSDVTALWAGGTCSGYLSSNGTCSTTLGLLPVNNPTFTGNLSGPTASITSLTTAGIVTNTASGVLGTATGTNGYFALWNSLGNIGASNLDQDVTSLHTITSHDGFSVIYNFGSIPSTPVTPQGLLMGWNATGGSGESDFFSNKGSGATGGFQFYNWNGSSYALIALLSPAGNTLYGTTAIPVLKLTGTNTMTHVPRAFPAWHVPAGGAITTGTPVGPVFWSGEGSVIERLTANLAGSNSCTVAPVVAIVSCTTAACTSTTTLTSLTTGTANGIFDSGALSVTIPASVFFTAEFTAGTCTGKPSFDAAATVRQN